VTEAIVESISPSTVWRILDADALKPWRRQSWVYPRDPLFWMEPLTLASARG